ncbi:MAG: mechanosensitive ion channel family protein [Demequina sp.]
MVFSQAEESLDDATDAWYHVIWGWVVDASGTLLTMGFILIGALIVWLIGRLIIRGIVHGISEGVDIVEDQTKDVLTRVRLSEYSEETIDDQLADDRRVTRANTIGLVLRAALNVAVIVLTVLMILDEAGISVAPVLASAGIVGVALGFGAQSLVKDLLAGIFMLLEDQYGVGDVVDVGEAIGLVEEVGLRSTRLRGLDGTVWFVPNGEIRRVGNMSQLYSRALIEVRFAYDVDVAAARQAILDAIDLAREDEDINDSIIGEPEVAGVENMDYQSVMLRLIVQVKPLTQWAVMRGIRVNMRDLFLERGIRLAAPEGSLIQHDTEVEPKRTPRTDPKAPPRTETRRPNTTDRPEQP